MLAAWALLKSRQHDEEVWAMFWSTPGWPSRCDAGSVALCGTLVS